MKFSSLPVTLRHNEGHGFLILQVSRSHTMTQPSRYECGESLIPLPDNTTQQTSIPPEGFEPATTTTELPQTQRPQGWM
jgi:hypothetical protein